LAGESAEYAKRQVAVPLLSFDERQPHAEMIEPLQAFIQLRTKLG
jgi:hypothetical protein